MQRGTAAKLDLRPFEIADFDCAETMAVRDQDQRSVSMRVAAFPSGLDELFDFGGRQILPRPELFIARPDRNCPVLVTWIDDSKVHADRPPPSGPIGMLV